MSKTIPIPVLGEVELGDCMCGSAETVAGQGVRGHETVRRNSTAMWDCPTKRMQSPNPNWRETLREVE